MRAFINYGYLSSNVPNSLEKITSTHALYLLFYLGSLAQEPLTFSVATKQVRKKNVNTCGYNCISIYINC